VTVPRIPEDALIAIYEEAQENLRAATFPALIAEEVTDDDETYMALRCPRCGHLIEEGDLRAVSPAESWDYNEQIGDWEFDHQLVSFGRPDNPDLQDTLYITHGDSPGHGVSLPDGWKEDWG
jgi:uncharacterized C2H2 Zn-finger protein